MAQARALLKLTNQTKWQTRGLRRIFSACIAEVRKTDDNVNMRNMRVTVTMSRRWVSGYAYYNRNIVRMKIPSAAVLESYRSAYQRHGGFSRTVANIFLHELGHCLGRRHFRGKTFEGCFTTFLETITDESYPLAPVTKKAVTKDGGNIITIRYARVLANLKKADSRLKRARTIQKKWATKKKYYERKMAAVTEKVGAE